MGHLEKNLRYKAHRLEAKICSKLNDIMIWYDY